MKSEISSGGIVFCQKDQEWQVLLVKHAATKYWGFPKGVVADHQKNESLKEAALREVQEEGGVKAKIITALPSPTRYQTSWRGEPIDKTVHYFVMQYLSGNPNNHDQEVSQAGFFTIEQASQTLTYENDRQNLKKGLVLLLGIEPRTTKL